MLKILLPNANEWIDCDELEFSDKAEFTNLLQAFCSAYSLPFDRENVKIQCDVPAVQKIIDGYQPYTKNISIFIGRIMYIYSNHNLEETYTEHMGMIKALDERL